MPKHKISKKNKEKISAEKKKIFINKIVNENCNLQ